MSERAEPGETVREKLEKAQAKILTMMRAADAGSIDKVDAFADALIVATDAIYEALALLESEQDDGLD